MNSIELTLFNKHFDDNYFFLIYKFQETRPDGCLVRSRKESSTGMSRLVFLVLASADLEVFLGAV